MHWRLATVLVALTIIAGGCGGIDDDLGQTPATTPPAEAASPSTTPAPTEDPISAQSKPVPGPTGTADPIPEPAPHPSDAFFALERVLDISIEIDTEDWDTLRHQTRTFEDVMAEIEEYGLSRPFASIYSWFSATVTVDGETHTNVGVRKKGFLGSQSDVKPALKLRFDKYVDGQSLGGVMERMTLNNSVQDPSLINTCLTYRVFAAAGNPAPRCNFATVSVNGRHLGLYVHVEEIKPPFLLRHFDSAEGNLYEGTVSDFTPLYRGTIEKKNNEDADDWSDIEAVVMALQDRSDAGLKALGDIVDLDRFLSFWTTEVLVGQWDGYAGNRNNYWFYREPHGRFVFIPWGTDATFHLEDDPNPFDNISNPPPSVLALTAIPNRLYNHPDWRAKYVERLKELLDSVWHEEELLAAVDEMAAIVQEHARPEEKAVAASDAERVRKFILKRRGEILADLTPRPPDWPEPEIYIPPSGGSGTLEVTFQTTWGSNRSANPLAEGTVHLLLLDGSEEPVEDVGVFAGYSSPEERALLPGIDNLASIIVAGVDADGRLTGMTLVIEIDLLATRSVLVIETDAVAGGVWSVPPQGLEPDWFSPFTQGTLELSAAGTTPSAVISGTFSGVFGYTPDADATGDFETTGNPTPGASNQR
ncbi:MAG: CotH kinase family protein [bacterium]|nr:CotH kinase family protein [bacterium]